ncbi:unnamed protein product [Peniophora sp. CBMAI 1063]|nr:unnamed protein product [Peniophora sp. CBMAI 1063]
MVDSWNPKDPNVKSQLRADLKNLTLPLIKAENVQKCKKHRGKGLELWWRDQKASGPFHNTIEKVFNRLSAATSLPEGIARLQLYYLPQKHTVLYPNWIPRWNVDNPASSTAHSAAPPVASGSSTVPALSQSHAAPALPITPQSAFTRVGVSTSTSTHASSFGASHERWGLSPTLNSKPASGWVDFSIARTSAPSSVWGPPDLQRPTVPIYRPITPPYTAATAGPLFPAEEVDSPIRTEPASSLASHRSPASTHPTSPISEGPETLASVCLAEFADLFSGSLDHDARRRNLTQVTQSLFDAEPQHRPSGPFIALRDIRRATVMALCARAECASELEVQLQEAIVKNHETAVQRTRDIVAAESRAQDLAVTVADLRSRYETLSGEREETKAALDRCREENEHLSSRVESLQKDLEKAQSQRATFQTAWSAMRTKVQDVESKLAAAEDKVSKQQVALSAFTGRGGRIQDDFARSEDERRQEQGAHAREREGWQAERAQMRAQLDALQAENARSFVTPALMDAFLGVNDMPDASTCKLYLVAWTKDLHCSSKIVVNLLSIVLVSVRPSTGKAGHHYL